MRISGEVGESVLVAAVRLETTGRIGADVSGFVGEARVGGEVGRDVLVVGGSAEVTARVGRDVRSQAWRLVVNGEVGRDVVARVDDMVLGDAARIAGDVTFRASDEVRVADAATVSGSLVRAEVLAPVWAKALTRLLGWLSVLGFVVAGVALFWLFRGTAPRAVRVARERPGRSALVGLGVLVVPPILALPLFLTLVGLPVAILLLLFWVVGLFLGPIPAVAAAGERLLGGRGGVLGGFVVGALLWRGGMWLLSLAAAVLYLVPLVIGLGAFTIGAWEARRGKWAGSAGGGGVRDVGRPALAAGRGIACFGGEGPPMPAGKPARIRPGDEGPSRPLPARQAHQRPPSRTSAPPGPGGDPGQGARPGRPAGLAAAHLAHAPCPGRRALPSCRP